MKKDFPVVVGLGQFKDLMCTSPQDDLMCMSPQDDLMCSSPQDAQPQDKMLETNIRHWNKRWWWEKVIKRVCIHSSCFEECSFQLILTKSVSESFFSSFFLGGWVGGGGYRGWGGGGDRALKIQSVTFVASLASIAGIFFTDLTELTVYSSKMGHVLKKCFY